MWLDMKKGGGKKGKIGSFYWLTGGQGGFPFPRKGTLGLINLKGKKKKGG